MRSYVAVVAFSGSEVPSGSSPVYQRSKAGLFLIRLTSSVTAVWFMYVLCAFERSEHLAARNGYSPSHIIHQVDTDFFHSLDDLCKGSEVVKGGDRVYDRESLVLDFVNGR